MSGPQQFPGWGQGNCFQQAPKRSCCCCSRTHAVRTMGLGLSRQCHSPNTATGSGTGSQTFRESDTLCPQKWSRNVHEFQFRDTRRCLTTCLLEACKKQISSFLWQKAPRSNSILPLSKILSLWQRTVTVLPSEKSTLRIKSWPRA